MLALLMKTLAACFLIALSGQVCAQDWGKTDTAMLAGALTLATIDWGQTRDLVRQQRQGGCIQAAGQPAQPCPSSPMYDERANFFLPAHPTTAQVDKSFAIGMAFTAGMAYVLPQTYRRWFLGGVIVLEAGTVIHNHSIGLRVDF